VPESTPEEVLAMVESEGCEFVDFRFIDLPGVMQHVTIPASVLDEGQFRCLYQPIDKLVVTNSNFDDCLLYYGGDPISYFGSNNIIANSTLILGPNVSDDSSFVRNFRTLYPDVPIKKGTSDVR